MELGTSKMPSQNKQQGQREGRGRNAKSHAATSALKVCFVSLNGLAFGRVLPLVRGRGL